MRKFIGRLMEWFLSYNHKVKFTCTSAYSNKPRHGYMGDAGYDLFCSETVVIPPLSYGEIPSSMRFELPKGIFLLIRGRSSTLRKYGLIVTDNIIDNGYRGEMYTCVHNTKDFEVKISCGERISQVVPFRLIPLEFKNGYVDEKTDRGISGFGSSGA